MKVILSLVIGILIFQGCATANKMQSTESISNQYGNELIEMSLFKNAIKKRGCHVKQLH